MWPYTYEYSYGVNIWSPELAVAGALLAASIYGVWQVWRGLRLDSFQRKLRSLRDSSRTRVSEKRLGRPANSDSPALPRRLGQIGLLPLMLSSAALALLIAQASRPNDMSRGGTWLIFVTIGAWFGADRLSRRRGIGPLRNRIWGGVISAASISVALWSCYLVVDQYREFSYQRIPASFGSMLWWLMASACQGGFVGSIRASRWYQRLAPDSPTPCLFDNSSDESASETRLATFPEIEDANDSRRRTLQRPGQSAWGIVLIGCAASLLFHCSVAPQFYKIVRTRILVHWDEQLGRRPSNDYLVLAMAAPAASVRISNTLTDQALTDQALNIVGSESGYVGDRSQTKELNLTPEVSEEELVSPTLTWTGYRAARDIRRGERLTRDHIVLRGGQPKPILGAIAAMDLRANQYIDAEHITTVAPVDTAQAVQETTLPDYAVNTEKLGAIDLDLANILDSQMPPRGIRQLKETRGLQSDSDLLTLMGFDVTENGDGRFRLRPTKGIAMRFPKTLYTESISRSAGSCIVRLSSNSIAKQLRFSFDAGLNVTTVQLGSQNLAYLLTPVQYLDDVRSPLPLVQTKTPASPAADAPAELNSELDIAVANPLLVKLGIRAEQQPTGNWRVLGIRPFTAAASAASGYKMQVGDEIVKIETSTRGLNTLVLSDGRRILVR